MKKDMTIKIAIYTYGNFKRINRKNPDAMEKYLEKAVRSCYRYLLGKGDQRTMALYDKQGNEKPDAVKAIAHEAWLRIDANIKNVDKETPNSKSIKGVVCGAFYAVYKDDDKHANTLKVLSFDDDGNAEKGVFLESEPHGTNTPEPEHMTQIRLDFLATAKSEKQAQIIAEMLRGTTDRNALADMFDCSVDLVDKVVKQMATVVKR